jgi:hypothetical protein
MMAALAMNTIIAVNPVPAAIEGDAREFVARLEPAGSWRQVPDGQLALSVTVTNAGRGFWPMGVGPTYPLGTVTLGPYLPADEGERVELPHMPLPRSLSPGGSVGAEVRIPAASVEGRREVGATLSARASLGSRTTAPHPWWSR